MHRKLVFIVIMIHVFFMMLVVAYNLKFDFSSKGMILTYVFLFYAAVLIAFKKFRKIFPLLIIGTLLYFLFNLSALTFFIIGDPSNVKTSNVILLMFAFFPGIYGALFHSIFLIKDRKLYKTMT